MRSCLHGGCALQLSAQGACAVCCDCSFAWGELWECTGGVCASASGLWAGSCAIGVGAWHCGTLIPWFVFGFERLRFQQRVLRAASVVSVPGLASRCELVCRVCDQPSLRGEACHVRCVVICSGVAFSAFDAAVGGSHPMPSFPELLPLLVVCDQTSGGDCWLRFTWGTALARFRWGVW